MKKKLYIFLALVLSLVLLSACANTAVETETSESTESADASTEDSGEAVVSSADMPKGIVAIEEWEEFYPDHVADFQATSDMSQTTYGGSVQVDYLAEYPWLNSFYEGYVFEHQYDRARGHIYAYEDAVNTARPKAGASCLTCKVSEFNELYNEDPSVAAMDFEQFIEEHPSVGMACFDCHGENPGEIRLNRKHLTDAIDEYDYLSETLRVDSHENALTCAQCHTEYYLTHEEKYVTLPWSEGLGADEAYAYYQEHEFADWEHPQTGTPLIKAQHPEVETFTGSVHEKAGLSCIDCHMPTVEADQEAEDRHSHHWTSPLKNAEASCLRCHSGDTEDEIIAKAEALQKPIVEKTDELGPKIEEIINGLAAGIADGSLTEDEITELRDIHREAQFYWDYVFVENGEGFHNNEKQMEYLDHAEELVEEGLAILGK